MNTPFKMKPGRGNMPKTGNGLPTPLRQDHGGDIELTKKWNEIFVDASDVIFVHTLTDLCGNLLLHFFYS